VTALRLLNVRCSRGCGRGAVQALDGVTVEVRAGEVVLLQGPSGSGKTTLLAIAGGLLTSDDGEVWLERHALHGITAGERLRLRSTFVGFVFQRPNLLSRLTVRQNVLVQAVAAGMPSSESDQAADSLLDALGISHLSARTPAELSGGEQQRAAVARALVHRPAVVLADEPTASLDGTSGLAVAERLSWLARECGSAVLIGTHDPRLHAVATRQVALRDGRIEPEES
jgi:putative ABC transport system ATP-binding protein